MGSVVEPYDFTWKTSCSPISLAGIASGQLAITFLLTIASFLDVFLPLKG